MPSNTRRTVSLAALACMLFSGAPVAAAGDIPEPLNGIVYSGSKRVVSRVTLNGIAFDSVTVFSDLPYLLWPVTPAPATTMPGPDTDDPQSVGTWLALAANQLGYTGFTPRFAERFAWKDHEVFAYDLVHAGIPLHDARILVHRDQSGILGIVNQIDGRVISIDAANPAVAEAERAYYLVPAPAGDYRAMAVRADQRRFSDRSTLDIIAPDGRVLESEVSPDPVMIQRDDTPVFTEYNVPGSFPDQISVAEDGMVWYSEPNNNQLVEFDPLLEQFTFHNTTGASGPDGMIVGSANKVWTGMYYSGGLGVVDGNTNTFTNYPSPYSPSAMAIPVETSNGSIWVTDHANNRISEFDPVNEVFLQTIIMPTPNCWVVQGHEDTSRAEVYFTEYNANRLGRLSLANSTVTDIITPGGGPAFCVYSNDKVYYSRWSESGIGVLDIPSGVITEYEFPVNNEPGGPLWIRPSGDIVVGTRNQGYVMVFHVDTLAFSALPIPTSFAGLKDGMTVGADDIIWFTETGVRKIAKLEFCLNSCPADFNGDGDVNTLDVLAFLNAWSDGDPEADINEDGTVNTLDVLAFLNLWGAGC
ncbi:MAG: GC-type dockerin domain-anchored protein [Phycisphaerales bacterium JB054]